MPALLIASFAAITPKSTAESEAKAPPKDPIGVLALLKQLLLFS